VTRHAAPIPATVDHRTRAGRVQVKDANGFAVAYTYGDDTPRGASANKLTAGEARRIAVNITRLPGLLRQRSPA
jgi:hypothetical protein